jgi:hypothetical protein
MTYSFDDFHACLAQDFTLDTGGGDTATLSLISVEKNPHSESVDGREVFSVLFRGPADKVLPQQTYAMNNQDMGELALFIVPIGPDKKGMCYEAVFT